MWGSVGLVEYNDPYRSGRRRRYAAPMNWTRVAVFVIVMGLAVVSAVAGHFGAYVITLLVVGVVAMLFALIFRGFVNEVGKMRRK